jgi:hypothetical protein
VVRATAVLGSALLPLLVVLLLPAFAGWSSVLPEIFEPKGDPASVAELLGNLSLSLSSIAIASVVGAGILLRERAANTERAWPLSLSGVIVAAGIIAVYSGYRFQVGVAEQLSVYQLEMERVGNRLEWQASAVLACTCFLIALAVDTFVFGQPQSAPRRRNRRAASQPARRRRAAP